MKKDRKILGLVRKYVLAHPSRDDLRNYVSLAPERELAAEDRKRVTWHLEECPECSSFVAEVAKEEEVLMQEAEAEAAAEEPPPTEEDLRRADAGWKKLQGELNKSGPQN